MSTKLTYEEFCEKYMAPIDPAMIEDLQKFHGAGATKEVEDARRREYEFYINGGFNK